MIHRHFCPSCRQHNPCDAVACIRDKSFECLACCVEKLRRKRPELFLDAPNKVETKKGSQKSLFQ